MNDVEKLIGQVSDFKSYTGMLERKIAMIEEAVKRLENDRQKEIERLQNSIKNELNENELTENEYNYIKGDLHTYYMQGELHTYEMLQSEITFLKNIVEF